MTPDNVPRPVACPRHPAVETLLRCARCDAPICPKCLVQAPVGARCPDCARPTAGLAARPSLPLYLRGGAAGLAVAMLAGVLLPFLGFGIFNLLLIVLAGYLVGEAVSSVTRRLPYRGLAVVAFLCASLGPSVGRALLVAVVTPHPDLGVRVMFGATAALRSLDPLEILALIVAGIVASNRVLRF
jgi:hypothetical protein